MKLFVFLSSIIVYSKHIPITIFWKFVDDYHISIMVITLSLLFLRIPLGMLLDYRENKNKPTDDLHFKLVGILYLVGWWKAKNKENKTLAIMLNVMLVLVFIIFFGILFGLIFLRS